MNAHTHTSVENDAPPDQITMHTGVSQEITDILQKIVQNAGDLIDAQQCSIALLDARDSVLVTRAALQKSGLRRTRFRLDEGVAGWVATHREVLVIENVELDTRFKRLGRKPVGSMVCVPLIDAGRFVGTITASSPHLNAFDATKARLLTIFADQAVLAIINARYAMQADRYAGQLELLLDLSHGMMTPLDPPALYHTILTDLQRLIHCTLATIYRYREATQELYPVARLSDGHILDGDAVQAGAKIHLYDDASMVAWAAVHRHPMLLAPGEANGGTLQADASEPAAQMAAPLVSKDVLYGVLVLKRSEPFNSEELRLVRHVATIAVVALENMELLQGVRAEREQLSAILASISDGIALIDEGGVCLEANAPLGRMLGIEGERVVGMDVVELFGGEDVVPKSDALYKVQQAIQMGQMLPYMEFDLLLEGTARSLGISIMPITMARGRLSLLAARDVTAIRDATRMKANFLSMITHELRSPLNSINGYLDLALEGVVGELNPQLREFLQRARAGSEHLYALVEDLLLVARVDAGQLRLNRQVVTLERLIEDSLEELELTATDRNITVVVELPTSLPRLYADPMRIQQVLRNLLGNALRYTESGGRVTIAAEVESIPQEQDDEPVKLVRLIVSDTGCGIALEHQQRIFERFYQIVRPGSRSSGQGLGLAIVKMIVELHGGHVTVESVPDQGSTFSCTFPGVLS